MTGIDILVSHFANAHPSDAARVLETLTPDEAAAFLDGESPVAAAGVLTAMEPLAGAACVAHMAADRQIDVVGIVELENAAALVRRLDEAAREALLAGLPSEIREPLDSVLRFPQDTAGGLMDPRALALPDDITLQEALGRVRRYPDRASYYLFVIDRQHALVGVVNIRELMLGDEGRPVSEAMRANPVRLNVNEQAATVLAHPGWLEFQILPVVDDSGRLVGALRHRTLRRMQSDPTTRVGGRSSAGGALGELFQIGLTGMAQITGPGPHPTVKGASE